jgi:hypothetical protein
MLAVVASGTLSSLRLAISESEPCIGDGPYRLFASPVATLFASLFASAGIFANLTLTPR